jgi:hypothetical protein
MDNGQSGSWSENDLSAASQTLKLGYFLRQISTYRTVYHRDLERLLR